MIDIFLVRHGETVSPWSLGHDAGLSERGRAQAAMLAHELAVHESAAICSSPLQRALETARPLSDARRLTPAVDERFQEVPIENDVARRKAWLSAANEATWDDVDARILRWREAAFEALLAIRENTIVFTHFMLINAVVSRATDDRRLVCFEPDYASVTALRMDPRRGHCAVVRHGRSID